MNNSNKILAILVVLAMLAVMGFTTVTADANASDDDKIDTYQELVSAIEGTKSTIRLNNLVHFK